MTTTISVKEAARQWNLTERRVSALCKAGAIKGAFKKGVPGKFPLIRKSLKKIRGRLTCG